MRENYVRLIILLKRLSGLLGGKTPKSSREPQKSPIIYFNKEYDKEEFIDRALCLQKKSLKLRLSINKEKSFQVI